MPMRSGLRRPLGTGVSDTAAAYGRGGSGTGSGADEDRHPDARRGPQGTGQRAEDEPLGGGRRLPELVVAAQPLDGEDDGEPFGPAGEERPRDRRTFEHADPGAA